MRMPIRLPVAAALATSLLIGGCATYTGQTSDPNDPNRTRNGALIGAAIGAVAGILSGDDALERRQRALVGAGVGAIAGGAVGAYQDRQEAELRRRTAGTGIEVTRDGDVIKLNLPDAVTFDFNSAALKPQFYPALDQVAGTMADYNQTVVEISGHTDSVGSDDYNQKLSEQRAASVSNYLVGKGLMRQRFEVVGMGERYPIASNDTDAGRAQNRRVEIRVVPLTNQAGG
ncbi:MAG: OmpA family protein [Xanthomonadales bacterium]|nr:OmpA family protein [Xanthomonadales bacterium]